MLNQDIPVFVTVFNRNNVRDQFVARLPMFCIDVIDHTKNIINVSAEWLIEFGYLIDDEHYTILAEL